MAWLGETMDKFLENIVYQKNIIRTILLLSRSISKQNNGQRSRTEDQYKENMKV